MAPGTKRKITADESSKKRHTMAVPNGKASQSAAVSRMTISSLPKEAPAPAVSSGELLVYGNNEAGQLGLEDPSQSKRYPFHLVFERVGGRPVHAIVCGGMHSIIINTDGHAYTWGCNDEGALGTGPSDEDSWRPKLVKLTQKVKQVSAGDSHTAFLTETGQIYLTGTMRDANGAFGLNIKSGDVHKVPFLHMDNKSRVEGVIRDNPVKISSGYNHFAVLNKKYEVHLLGDSSNSQLGPIPARRKDGGRDGRGYFLQRRKVYVEAMRKRTEYSDVWCTPYGTFVRFRQEDRWFACGNNMKNQLGFPNEQENGIQEEWREVTGLRNRNIVKIVGTPTHTIALSEIGDLYVFGNKEYLGLSRNLDDTCTEAPLLHPVCQTLKFRDIGCASNNATVGVTVDGDLYVWGSPSSSLVATEEDEMDAVPEPTKVTSKNTAAFKLSQVSVGGAHSLLLGTKRDEQLAATQ